jgi:hypothetical protein
MKITSDLHPAPPNRNGAGETLSHGLFFFGGAHALRMLGLHQPARRKSRVINVTELRN